VPTSPWSRIKEHKIIQWALGYLAAALALTHAEELVAHAYGWPESIGQILIAVLGIGLPVAVTLAWYHGHRASRHVSGAEATIIAILLLMGAGFLSLFVRPHQPSVTQSVKHGAAPTASQVPSAVVPLTRASTGPPLAPAPTSGRPRLAILPFENLSPDPANAFFTDGLHEEIISTLAKRANGLEVISSTTLMLYRTAPKSVRTISSELGATHVLEGSVRREGDAVRLTLQLIDAKSDKELWSQDFDRTLKSALALQSEVAEQVAAQLLVQLSGDAAQMRQRTTDPEAYDLYLKAHLARQQLSTATTPAEVENITALLTQAIQRDPNFAQARVELANHHLRGYRSGLAAHFGDDSDIRLAREQLDAAQVLIPGDPVLTVTQAYYNYITDAAIALTPAVEAAVTYNVQDSLNLVAANTLFSQAGRFADDLVMLQRLAELDPASPAIAFYRASALRNLRRPQQALGLYDNASSRPGWGLASATRAELVFDCTGTPGALHAWRAAFERMGATKSDFRLDQETTLMRFEHRYPDLRAAVARSGLSEMTPAAPTGSVPVGELLGWAALLSGDLGSVRDQSVAVAAFAASKPKTGAQAWYGKTLLAEARLFAGDYAGAIAAAQSSLSMRPRARDAWTWSTVAGYNAQVLAWAGAQDQAVQLLESLSTVEGGLYPAEIVRDPLYTVPLAGNSRYQALKARLEAQMASTKLE
jgi:TolB-like protein